MLNCWFGLPCQSIHFLRCTSARADEHRHHTCMFFCVLNVVKPLNDLCKSWLVFTIQFKSHSSRCVRQLRLLSKREFIETAKMRVTLTQFNLFKLCYFDMRFHWRLLEFMSSSCTSNSVTTVSLYVKGDVVWVALAHFSGWQMDSVFSYRVASQTCCRKILVCPVRTVWSNA